MMNCTQNRCIMVRCLIEFVSPSNGGGIAILSPVTKYRGLGLAMVPLGTVAAFDGNDALKPRRGEPPCVGY